MSRVALLNSRRTPTLGPGWTVDIGDHVSALAWSPDKRLLGAAALGGPVYLLDATDGRCVATLPGHEFGTAAVGWRPGQTVLATGGQDGKVRLWSAPEGKCLAELTAGADWVECLAWSMDGGVLATGAGRKLRLWTPDGDLLRECSPHASTVTDIVWHPTRQQLATACYGGVSFWQPERTDPIRQFAWKGSLLSLAWSPNGKLLASGNQDSSVHFWFVADGEDLHMGGYAVKVRELAWSADSRLLATGGSVDVVIWDCSKRAGPANTRPSELQYHGALIAQLAFQRKGDLLASGCAAGAIAIWKPREAQAPLGAARLSGAISQLTWSPDGARVAAATSEGMVGMFEAPAT